jgi:predicted  nucleic acid-binding Zn-ribbon protein
MDEVETLASQLIEAVHKLQEQHAHLTQTTVEVKAELAGLHAERDQMKAQRDVLSAEVGRLSGERNRLLRMLGVEEAA